MGIRCTGQSIRKLDPATKFIMWFDKYELVGPDDDNDVNLLCRNIYFFYVYVYVLVMNIFVWITQYIYKYSCTYDYAIYFMCYVAYLFM